MRHCPRCGTILIWKKNAFGSYLGCANYPECAAPVLLPKPPEPAYEQQQPAA